jgi:hypothetical protein
MPNEALIETLDRLRETYSQRQKSTNSLLTTLKGTTSALGKASRNLRDYLEQSSNGNGTGLTEAQEAFAQGLFVQRLRDEVADPLLPDLRREAKTLNGLVNALRDALTALRGESVDVIRLGRAYQALQAGAAKGSRDDTLAALLPELQQELQYAQKTLGETFGQALRHAVAELGIEIRGRPPRFELGRFEINADFVNRSASISYGKELVTRRVPLSVEAVIRAYQRDAKAIMGRNEDGDRWIEQLYTAWQNAQRRRDTPPRAEGVRVNIVECYYELTLLRQPRAFRSAPSKQSFVDYTRPQFAYDFFEFANQQRRAYRGFRAAAHGATKSQTENVERGIWIVEGNAPYDGRFIADIVFSKED